MAVQCASRALAAIELQFLQCDPFGYYAYRSVVRGDKELQEEEEAGEW